MLRLAKRLIAWILPLLATIGVLSWASVPNPDSFRPGLLTACDLPCWGGLTPGLTDRDEIVNSLLGYYPQLFVPMVGQASLISFGGVIDDEGISGVIEFSGRKVHNIRLNTPIVFADLLDALGTPDCVHFLPPASRNVMDVIWEIGDISIRTLLEFDNQGRLTTDMQAQDLEIGLIGVPYCQADALPWRGFAPVWRYRPEDS